jgi:hypothetical protein
MDPLGYTVTAAVLRAAMKETPCSFSWALSNHDTQATKILKLLQHRHVYVKNRRNDIEAALLSASRLLISSYEGGHCCFLLPYSSPFCNYVIIHLTALQ